MSQDFEPRKRAVVSFTSTDGRVIQGHIDFDGRIEIDLPVEDKPEEVLEYDNVPRFRVERVKTLIGWSLEDISWLYQGGSEADFDNSWLEADGSALKSLGLLKTVYELVMDSTEKDAIKVRNLIIDSFLG